MKNDVVDCMAVFCIVNCGILFFGIKINEQNVVAANSWFILFKWQNYSRAGGENLYLFENNFFFRKWNNEKCETKRNERGALAEKNKINEKK